MKYGQLSDYFEGVAFKRLKPVDADPKSSNQHEVGTTKEMRRFLGEELIKFEGQFLYIEDENSTISADGALTHYDSRKGKPRSAEWRLYYQSNFVTEVMQAGDTLFLAKKPDGSLMFIVASQGSTIEAQLIWLFGFDDEPTLRFEAKTFHASDNDLDFATRLILDEIGIELAEVDTELIDRLVEPFGIEFPTTKVFSKAARDSLGNISRFGSVDIALLSWMEREEEMFRRMEKKILRKRLQKGFDPNDVDGFIGFSLSVQNRRKSRAGYAFGNHIAAIFDELKIEYKAEARTEKKAGPDFLFPSEQAYHDAAFPNENLKMLGAKTSLKDRWRQVLREADRIWPKHLITMQPAISENQTAEMIKERLRLVVPQPIHQTYSDEQQDWLLSFEDFIALVK